MYICMLDGYAIIRVLAAHRKFYVQFSSVSASSSSPWPEGRGVREARDPRDVAARDWERDLALGETISILYY
jgi:hypothetical protein